jgi:hypothetical protein
MFALFIELDYCKKGEKGGRCCVVYSKCRVSNFNGCVKFEFNDISLYIRKTILSGDSLSAYIIKGIFHDVFFLIFLLVIYFTISITVAKGYGR